MTIDVCDACRKEIYERPVVSVRFNLKSWELCEVCRGPVMQVLQQLKLITPTEIEEQVAFLKPLSNRLKSANLAESN